MNDDLKNNFISDLDDTEIKKLEAILKKIVAKYNSDSKIKAKLKELGASKLTCDFENNGKNEGYFIISDDDQGIRIELSDIIDDIAEDFKNEINNSQIYISTGDGDEGCIYISI